MGRLLTTAQVCEKLSISRRHLQTLRSRGLFRTIRVSERSLRFDEDDLDAYLRGVPSAAPAPAPSVRPVERTFADLQPDYAWLASHGSEYAGHWVALSQGRLVASSTTLSELRASLATQRLPSPPLVHRCE